jgi:hypothetical protein
VAEGEDSPAEQAAAALATIDGFHDEVGAEGLGRATAVLVDGLHARPALRQAVERECEARLGVGLPRDPATRQIYSSGGGGAGPNAAAATAASAEQEQEQGVPTSFAEAPTQTGDYMPADKYMTLPPGGTVIITHYDTMHRGSPRLPGSRWRPMIRFKFFRVSEPADAIGGVPRPAFSPSGGSVAQKRIWEAIWTWHGGGGGAPTLSQEPLPAVAEVLASPNDVERVGVCYAMAQHAAAAGPAAGEALAQLDELLRCAGRPVVQRAAMYGLAAAGPAATPALLRILRSNATAAACAACAADPLAADGLNTALRALFALGETAVPTTDTVALLGELLARFQGHLQVCTVAPAAAGAAGATTGGALAGWHRATAICVQALSLLAERVADQATALQIAELLLPLTLELDPVGDAVPMHLLYTGSSNASFWISEGAAIGLLRLVSSAGAGSGGSDRASPQEHQAKVAAVRGGVVKRLAPASQTDQRFVQAFCMLALQRSLAISGRDCPLSRLLGGARSRWEVVYAAGGGSAATQAPNGVAAGGGEAKLTPTEWYYMG